MLSYIWGIRFFYVRWIIKSYIYTRVVGTLGLQGDVALLHSMQEGIQPMWAQPPLVWILFWSVFSSPGFLHLSGFTFSAISAHCQSWLTFYATVSMSWLRFLIALLYTQPSDSIKSGACKCHVQTGCPDTSSCLQCELSLLGLHIYISHCWFAALPYTHRRYLKLTWHAPSPGLHIPFHIYYRQVPCTYSVFCVLQKHFLCFSWSAYKHQKSTHILICVTPVHWFVHLVWDCRFKSHFLALSASIDTYDCHFTLVALLWIA